jgi:hypothetical protein
LGFESLSRSSAFVLHSGNFFRNAFRLTLFLVPAFGTGSPQSPLTKLGLVAELHACQVHESIVVCMSACPALAMSAAGDSPAAAPFVMLLWRPSWNGLM